jgi:hypothetical protein
MGVQSAQQLQESCHTFAGQLTSHGSNTTQLLNEATSHLHNWVGDCETFIGAETARIRDEFEGTHQPALTNFIKWCETHPAQLESLGARALELFAEVLG